MNYCHDSVSRFSQLQWVTRAGALSLDGQAGEEKVPTTLHSDDKDDEDLASVSTDGRALLWRLRKGIIASPLMHIKRESKVRISFT